MPSSSAWVLAANILGTKLVYCVFQKIGRNRIYNLRIRREHLEGRSKENRLMR